MEASESSWRRCAEGELAVTSYTNLCSYGKANPGEGGNKTEQNPGVLHRLSTAASLCMSVVQEMSERFILLIRFGCQTCEPDFPMVGREAGVGTAEPGPHCQGLLLWM